MGSKKKNSNRFKQINLVSDQQNIARTVDPLLINSWGLTTVHNSLWVADNGTGVLSHYDFHGNKLTPQQVNVPAPPSPPSPPSLGAPTGLVRNKTKGFNGALLITVTEDGTVNAYNPSVNSDNAPIVVDNSSSGTVYKGVTIVKKKLYATDFHNNKIDVFDSDFNTLTGFSFSDPNLPAGYAPFNIVYIFDKLYVTYAKQDDAKHDDVPGLGNGFVNVFTTKGILIRRLISTGALNSPWAVIAYSFDDCKKERLLVGNFGDGIINVFDFNGNFLYALTGIDGKFISIDGLWGLVPKNNNIFFASGPDHENHGLLGKLKEICKQ